MVDQLYLSLWFPNFRLTSLPEKLTSVLQQFGKVSGNYRISVASAIPLGWNESPVFQRIFVIDDRSEPTEDSLAQNAVAEATEQLHDDTAYEFEVKWQLWEPQAADEGLDATGRLVDATVKITGFGPEFDDASFDQNGHIRIDFGLDTPWVADLLDDTLEHLNSDDDEDGHGLTLDDDYDLEDADEDDPDDEDSDEDDEHLKTAAERKTEAQGYIQQ